jgi:hypothetical protein
MENLNIEESILHYLYCKNFGEGDPPLNVLDKWAVQQKFNKVVFWQQYDCILKKELAIFLQDEGTVRLTAKGVLHAEKAGLVSPEMIAKNRHIRKLLMCTLARHLEKRSTTISIDELIETAQLEGHYCYGNIDLLVSMGYIRWVIPRVSLSISAKVCAKDAVLSKAR